MKYIQHIEIEGYKSLKSVKADLDKGINVFIGQNSSGKTNFLQFISNLGEIFVDLETNYSYLLKWKVDSNNLTRYFKQENKYNFQDLKGLELIDHFKKLNSKSKFFKIRILKNNIIEVDFEGYFESIYHDFLLSPFFKKNLENELKINIVEFYHSTIIKGLDEILDLVVEISSSDGLLNFLGLIDFSNIFAKELANTLISVSNTVIENDFYDFSNASLALQNTFSEQSFNVRNNLKYYTLVEDIRISQSARVSKEENHISFESIRIQFKIDGIWRFWHELSDGTKRLINIFYKLSQKGVDICLIDEPELGIHPHQLMKLMEFIRIESEEKQIIISTHSPDVLDVLTVDELNNINIVSIENGSTKISKLTAEQKSKALDYYESTGSIGDYWKHSDLEV